MKKCNEIENFNKKSLYILIREMADVNTSHITKVMNILKKHYKILLKRFDRVGHVNVDKMNDFFL